ncbi:ATP synthase subunit epsilon, mitochondrial [Linum perenne]
MVSTAAVPFWRSAGLTYITYSNICANLVRNSLKNPYKAEALAREKVHFSVSKWAEGKPQKPRNSNSPTQRHTLPFPQSLYYGEL